MKAAERTAKTEIVGEVKEWRTHVFGNVTKPAAPQSRSAFRVGGTKTTPVTAPAQRKQQEKRVQIVSDS